MLCMSPCGAVEPWVQWLKDTGKKKSPSFHVFYNQVKETEGYFKVQTSQTFSVLAHSFFGNAMASKI